MAKIIVYHIGYCEMECPKIIKGNFSKDFGDGFYCSIMRDQAVRWANKYKTPCLNVYEYEENRNLKIKEFHLMSEEWLDFIIDCRNGKNHSYDIVVGAMADDQIYDYILDLLEGKISRRTFWDLAKFKYPTHQIAFCTDEALKCLHYMGNGEDV